TGPVVSTSEGKVSQLRTYQDLLKNPQDEQDFVSLATAELYWIDLQGQQTKFLSADLYTQANVSPDGKYVLVSKLKKPFSYVVAYNSFPQEANVYAIDGSLEQKVNETPLMEIMPKGFSSTRPGKRMLTWRADKPNTLFFVQALDGGDANKPVDFRDELFTWEYPFSAEPKSLTKVKDRFAGIIWGNDTYALVSSSWYDTRNSKSFVLNLTTGVDRLLIDRNSQHVYSHSGAVHRERNQFGTFSMFLNKDKTYWVGAGHTKEGEFPFIDELDLKPFQKKRIHTAPSPDLQERIAEVIDITKGDILISLQSAKQYPNYYTKNIKSGKQKAVTAIENPFKSLEAVHKEVLNYKRNDGV